jgi:uncharacterized protein (TIGR04442 family)
MAVKAVTMHMMKAGGDFPLRTISSSVLEKTRKDLANYFVFSTAGGTDMPDTLTLSVLLARKDAPVQSFEKLMLEIGAFCDERLDSTTEAGKAGQRNFLRLVGILQRMEEASKRINKLVLFAHGIPDIDTLKMLSCSWNELNAIKPGLFWELLVDDLLASDLPGRMGRKRLATLLEGLDSISHETGSLQDIQQRMERVEREEQILVKIVTAIQNAIGNRYALVAGDGERDTIKRIVSIELRHQRVLTGDEIPDRLFDVGLRLAKSSLMYMNTLLPIIVSQGDAGLREEFIRDSGLDRLLVEELEEFWCTREKVPLNSLDPIRSRS